MNTTNIPLADLFSRLVKQDRDKNIHNTLSPTDNYQLQKDLANAQAQISHQGYLQSVTQAAPLNTYNQAIGHIGTAPNTGPVGVTSYNQPEVSQTPGENVVLTTVGNAGGLTGASVEVKIVITRKEAADLIDQLHQNLLQMAQAQSSESGRCYAQNVW